MCICLFSLDRSNWNHPRVIYLGMRREHFKSRARFAYRVNRKKNSQLLDSARGNVKKVLINTGRKIDSFTVKLIVSKL